MRKTSKIISFLILILLLLPLPILANGGTALMYLPLFQLIIGNFAIGIVEAILLTIFFKTSWGKSTILLIAANYVSWIIGNIFIAFFQNELIDSIFQLEKVFTFWIISLIILYFLTAIIEAPFFRWSFEKSKRNWRRSFYISLMLNVFTYTLMILFYLSFSKYNFFTDLKIDNSILKNKDNFEIYYTKEHSIFNGLIKQDFIGNKIFNIPENYDSFGIELFEDTVKNSIDLYLTNYNKDSIFLKESFISEKEKIYYGQFKLINNFYHNDFRDTLNRTWNASANGWAIDGITIEEMFLPNKNYAFEVPWMFWQISNITILNDSELICVFNKRIILLNKKSKKIAFITKGNDYAVRKTNF